MASPFTCHLMTPNHICSPRLPPGPCMHPAASWPFPQVSNRHPKTNTPKPLSKSPASWSAHNCPRFSYRGCHLSGFSSRELWGPPPGRPPLTPGSTVDPGGSCFRTAAESGHSHHPYFQALDGGLCPHHVRLSLFPTGARAGLLKHDPHHALLLPLWASYATHSETRALKVAAKN